MKKLLILVLMLGMTTSAFAVDINTARGVVSAESGDVLRGNSFKSGTIDGANGIVFYRWNFARKAYKQQVFTNSSNLTFIGCNLRNVVVPDDSKVIDSNHFYRRKRVVGDQTFIIIENTDDTKVTYELVDDGDGGTEEVYVSTESLETLKRMRVKDARK